MAHPSAPADVLVLGAGINGLVLALGLAQAGLDLTLVGRPPPRSPGRTVALLEGSIALLERLGLWPDLADEAEPLRSMRIVDETRSLFRGPPVVFEAAEIGLSRFGCNIPNDVLIARLGHRARRTAGLRFVEAAADAVHLRWDGVTVSIEGGGMVEALLLAACDGRASIARKAARIPTRTWTYRQHALTAILRHDRAHREISTEFHRAGGPFTLVPLPSRAGAAHRSSLVWVMPPDEAERRAALAPDEFAAAATRASRHLLGRMELEEGIGRFPIGAHIADRLVGERLALVGEAAHAMPPIGAQGLNLGLRDVARLIDLVVAARAAGGDPGDARHLERYDRSRRGDVALRTIGVDWLNRSLLSAAPPVGMLRGAGLLAIDAVAPLRRALMRAGLTSFG